MSGESTRGSQGGFDHVTPGSSGWERRLALAARPFDRRQLECSPVPPDQLGLLTLSPVSRMEEPGR
jgi:hypothetical protein